MPDFMKILQQAQEMQGRFQKIQDELQQLTVSG
jgi:DNA-binding protein YbaB